MGAYGDMNEAVAGLLFGINSEMVESVAAKEEIQAGAPVMGYPGEENTGYNVHKDQVTLTLSADLIASNVYTVTINGTEIAETYATSHAATMAALIEAINTDADMLAAGIVAAAGSTNRIIVLKAKGIDLTVTGAVTLGATQASVTVATTTWSKFLGVAVFGSTSGIAGDAAYQIGDTVAVLAKGQIWVPCADDMTDKSAAYIDVANKRFYATNSGYDCGCVFRSNESGNLALLEIRGLK